MLGPDTQVSEHVLASLIITCLRLAGHHDGVVACVMRCTS